MATVFSYSSYHVWNGLVLSTLNFCFLLPALHPQPDNNFPWSVYIFDVKAVPAYDIPFTFGNPVASDLAGAASS